MSDTTNDLLGTVRSDGTLELAGKLTVPAGRVRVRVETVEPPVPPTESLIGSSKSGKAIEAYSASCSMGPAACITAGIPETFSTEHVMDWVIASFKSLSET